MLASICFARERRAHRVAAARVADARGEIADDQRYVVTRFGKALQLVQHDHEAQVQIGAGRIDAEFDVERTPQLQACAKVIGSFDVVESIEQELDVGKARVSHPSSNIVTPPEPSSSLP